MSVCLYMYAIYALSVAAVVHYVCIIVWLWWSQIKLSGVAWPSCLLIFASAHADSGGPCEAQSCCMCLWRALCSVRIRFPICFHICLREQNRDHEGFRDRAQHVLVTHLHRRSRV